MVVDPSELSVLILALLGFLPIVIQLRKRAKRVEFVVLSYTFLVLGLLFTVLEDWKYGHIFQLLEHGVCTALSGIFLAWGMWKMKITLRSNL